MKKLDSLLASGAMKDSTTVPFAMRPKVDRKNMGPMVRGYVNAILEGYPFNDIDDVTERALQQMIRDCVGFYWRYRAVFEQVWNDPFGEYGERQAGRDFWLSRNKHRGFIANSDPFDDDEIWDILESGAIGFGPFAVMLTNDGEIDADFGGWYANGTET